ncbi:hypothetical protein A3E39_00040 [Candidatus Uhrbacteria bacterium RIFCSPHIGHO2_12_FULL_60_25]|uniref:DUF5050 domain-containing protein n=1 Tax=Candidatus Uhrbacteria bacterium RIFCSPHIGHO2_12_FULL_60_25 TaxID=1802399 RepID=A0A1F7UML5_9BACT|nr:MAG: hypothetical protein A3D73_02745 [Candidatus Uhrbacteria bacterium RIFCSPHIGHO2_02_FULL_60_44]OGL79499.1 MAG: hypothetical protein A3E39_00040 [Candidatus Uhrbacteria bacterium RIFCSPHIGHO2_12_FULL_60_25]
MSMRKYWWVLFIIVIIVFVIGVEKNKKGDITLTGTMKNLAIERITMIHQEGARPRFAPDGKSFAFDRKNKDGYYDVYISDLEGNIIQSVTEGKGGITQRNNGNPTFDSTGGYLIFISEENDHLLDNQKYLADPGVGLFSNLYAADLKNGQFWQLTNIPIKKTFTDRIPATATVNPHFSKDGKTLIWTERYAEGGNNNWGRWRLKAADFVIENRQPTVRNERVVFTPTEGTYVTFMGQLDSVHWVVSGNLDGQHEYGMDQYVLNITTKKYTNLTNTSEYWEEDSSITPSGRIIYMSNADSRYEFDFSKNWVSQPTERDYYSMNADGSDKQRLTYFNQEGAPEYLGYRVLAVAADVSPDGKYLVSTLGYDFGKKKRDVVLKIALITFK